MHSSVWFCFISDFLLIVLKDLLPQRRDLRLVLMSATLNAELFSNYFKGAPTFHIPVSPSSSFLSRVLCKMNVHLYTIYQPCVAG